MKIFKYISLIVLFLTLNVFVANSATNIAASVEYADVNAAATNCADGDTLVIPAGSATWTNQLYIVGKSLNIYGAGQDKTFIIDNVADNYFFWIQESTATFFRWSGFTIIGSIYRAGTGRRTMGISGATNYFRFDHITISNAMHGCIYTYNWSCGLIDNCYFQQGSNVRPITGVGVNGDGWMSWTNTPASWGTTNVVCIEDCVFDWKGNGNGAVDSYAAARWVFRHNYCTNINVGCHGTDSTGLQSPSTLTWEVYNNYWTNSTDGNMLLLSFRGGTGLVFSNRFESHYIYPSLGLANYRCSGTNIYGGTEPCCNPVSGTNYLDGNADSYGYPPLHSIGWTSPMQFITNQISTNGLANAFTIQTQYPVYQWSNTVYSHILRTTQYILGDVINNYTNVAPYDYIPAAAWVIKKDRDYFDQTPKPGYTPLVYPHPLTQQLPPSTVVGAIKSVSSKFGLLKN
jgi:hypothetical protein